MQHPISNIEWIDAAELTANDYNPNRVHKPEWRLLRESILTTGWVQPILANKDGVIIDGFHRWRMAQDEPAIKKLTDGRVPVATMDISIPEAMLMTVRMNRAKGSHAAVSMSTLVTRTVKEYGYTIEQVMKGMGAPRKEVEVLLMEDVFELKGTKNHKYSQAWYPKQDGK